MVFHAGSEAGRSARKRRGAAAEAGPATRSNAAKPGAPGAGRGKVVGEETAALALLLLDIDMKVCVGIRSRVWGVCGDGRAGVAAAGRCCEGARSTPSLGFRG